eukprot:4048776-Heterocapsa_arctica.AAC.1
MQLFHEFGHDGNGFANLCLPTREICFAIGRGQLLLRLRSHRLLHLTHPGAFGLGRSRDS